MKSKKAGHTPGPWKIENARQPVNPVDGWIIKAEAAPCFPVALVSETRGGLSSPQAANTALIASAPELLKSLEAVTDMYEAALGGKYDDPDEAEIIDKARAAIAKARGE